MCFQLSGRKLFDFSVAKFGFADWQMYNKCKEEHEMRTEKQIYDTILNFAKADDRVRMVTLEGSRTNINILPDDFQDYDITFFVSDMQSFITDDEWLNIFGERLNNAKAGGYGVISGRGKRIFLSYAIQ